MLTFGRHAAVSCGSASLPSPQSGTQRGKAQAGVFAYDSQNASRFPMETREVRVPLFSAMMFQAV
jgi:hypothetical protein